VLIIFVLSVQLENNVLNLFSTDNISGESTTTIYKGTGLADGGDGGNNKISILLVRWLQSIGSGVKYFFSYPRIKCKTDFNKSISGKSIRQIVRLIKHALT